MRNKQNGFGALVIVVSIFVVVLIGVSAWLVLGKEDKKADTPTTKTATDAEKQQPTDKQDGSNTTEQQTAKPQAAVPEANKAAQGFLTINEWGVKIPLTTETANSYYVFENDAAYLRVDIPGDTQNYCSNQAALAKVTDYSESYDNWRQRPSELEKVGVKIGDAYYFIEGSQSACSEDETIQSKATAVRRAWLNQNKFITLK